MAIPTLASRNTRRWFNANDQSAEVVGHDTYEVDSTHNAATEGNAAILAVGMAVALDATSTTKVEEVNIQTSHGVLGVITELYNSSGKQVQYLAASTAGSVNVALFSNGVCAYLWEDGDGGVISGDHGYCDIIQAVANYTGDTIINPPTVTVMVDSSTANASASGLAFEYWVAQTPANVEPNGSSGDKRLFLVKPIAARIQ